MDSMAQALQRAQSIPTYVRATAVHAFQDYQIVLLRLTNGTHWAPFLWPLRARWWYARLPVDVHQVHGVILVIVGVVVPIGTIVRVDAAVCRRSFGKEIAQVKHDIGRVGERRVGIGRRSTVRGAQHSGQPNGAGRRDHNNAKNASPPSVVVVVVAVGAQRRWSIFTATATFRRCMLPPLKER